MKKCIKVLLTLCIILGMISTTAYAEETKPFEYEDDSIIAIVEGILTEVDSFTDYELDYYIDNSLGITKTICEEYKELRENDTLGEFVEIKDSKIENTKNAAIVTVMAAYEKTDVNLTVTYMEIKNGSEKSIVPVDIEITVSDSGTVSKWDSVKNAALNTLMGICIVVLMLTIISFIISLFKFIPKLQKKFSEKNNTTVYVDKAEDKVITQIIEKEEMSDDTELVAVITAAICAATGASGDSFVVRSIKKTRFR